MPTRNVTIEIGGQTFNSVGGMGVVGDFKVSAIRVDFFQSRTPVNTISFTLLKRAPAVASFLYTAGLPIIGSEITANVVRPGGNFIFKGVVTNASETSTHANISASQAIVKLKDDSRYNNSSVLLNNIVDVTTQVNIADPAFTPPQGLANYYFRIDNEFIQTTRVTNTMYTITGRAQFGTLMANHSSEAQVEFVTPLTGNPSDIIKNIIESVGLTVDGPSFDRVKNNIRNVTFNLYAYGQSNLINFVDRELLTPLGLRMYQRNDSNISLVELYSLSRALAPASFDDTTVKLGQTKFEIDSQKVYNALSFHYDFDHGANRFRQIHRVQDNDSIARFGNRELNFEIRGLTDTDPATTRYIGAIGASAIKILKDPLVKARIVTNNSILNINDVSEVNLSDYDVPREPALVLSKGYRYSSDTFYYFVRLPFPIGAIFVVSPTIIRTDPPIGNTIVGGPTADVLPIGIKMRIRARMPTGCLRTQGYTYPYKNNIRYTLVSRSGTTLTFDHPLDMDEGDFLELADYDELRPSDRQTRGRQNYLFVGRGFISGG